MTLSFQDITLNDVAILMPIENLCHSHPWSEKTLSSCIGGRYFGQLTKSGDTILGFYIGQYVANEATLMYICVSPEQQSKGFGKALLKQFIQQAKDRGANKLWLEVRAKNISAQMLYINHGFTEISRRTGYYPSASGMGYEDAIVMSAKV